jgi:hypothetical protein
LRAHRPVRTAARTANALTRIGQESIVAPGRLPSSAGNPQQPARRRVLAALSLLPALPSLVAHAGGAPASPVAPVAIDAGLNNALRTLDPDALSAADVRDVLARVPAPRIIALHGSVPLITMRPFAQFLIAMGYPEARIRRPADAELSYGSYVDSRELAGAIAWHYERDGIAPILLGHSQGGMATIRALHELAGSFQREVPVFDPVAGTSLPRTTIVDPLTGETRPVVGVGVPYAAAIATGKAMRVMLMQWDMLTRLRKIPDTVEYFDGFFIPGDPFTAFDGDDDRYRAIGVAQVRNVVLPGEYSHLGAPLATHLAQDPRTREWIERFDPRVATPALPADPDVDTRNLVHAAYIWHGVKRAWCIGAQRLAAARPA